ncbi:DUF4390 domain-containing protein [Desulfothermus okinawensis]
MASFLFPVNSFSQGITLKNVILNANNQDVNIQISLNVIDPNKLQKIITDNKLQAVFSCDVKIQKDRELFFDKTIISKKLEWLIFFNPINNQFTLKDKNGKIYSTNSLDTLLKKISNLNLKFPIWTTPTGKGKYHLILQFSLKRKVPYWIEKTLFFWNFDITPPSEYYIDFKF